MAVDYLSAINKQGSGLNITQIVDSLVAAETAPIEDKIKKQIAEKNAQISGYAIVANELGKLNSFAETNSGTTAYTVASDDSAVSVSVKDQSIASAFEASVAVSSLASAQTLEFGGFSSKTQLIGKGTINIEFGSWSGGNFTANSDRTSHSLTVTDSNKDLSSIASSLSSLAGVNATVTDKGDGTFSLIVNSDTGLKNAIKVSVSEDSSDTGLSALDTQTTNSAKQVVAASDATIVLNGVQITRQSNVFSDLIDGYEFTLNNTTSKAASITSSLDSDLAFKKVKDFVDLFNTINTSLDVLTKKGLNGEEDGALARDVVVGGIKKRLRSLLTSKLDGFGETGRYISELGIKTERDGSLSIEENDFKKKFAAEPILFDVMMNSLGTSSNPLVKVSHDSTILQPKGGVYNLIDNGDGNATLGGISISSSTLSDGTKRYSGISGDISGLKLDVSGSVTNATVFYGQSLFSKLTDYINEVVSSTGVLASSKTKANTSISEFNEDKADLDAKIESIRDRYMTQFSAMEAAVTGFKKTGEFLTGFIDALSPDK